MSKSEQRFTPESTHWVEKGDVRSPFQVDRDRILYSSALSRLAEITQVVSPDRGHVFHNRLTHSMKVAQLTRRIAERLTKRSLELAMEANLDPDAAEAAALAHDLGHPPFGHLAEEELNRLCKEHGGFEGNAQSFRIASRLSVSDALDADSKPLLNGLNLTRGTLHGLLKYPWLLGENPDKQDKWGAYEEEREVFEWVRDGAGTDRAVAAEVMDWADDITYAVHDVVDFYVAGKIPLDRLVSDTSDSELREFFDAMLERHPKLAPRRKELEEALLGILDYFSIRDRFTGSRDQVRQLWHYTSVLISRYASETKLVKEAGRVKLAPMLPEHRDEVFMLKELTWHYVILDPELGTLQRGQRRIVSEVFEALVDGTGDQKDQRRLFPEFIRDSIRESDQLTSRVRCVADYIASMTEREIARLHRRLSGRTVALS